MSEALKDDAGFSVWEPVPGVERLALAPEPVDMLVHTARGRASLPIPARQIRHKSLLAGAVDLPALPTVGPSQLWYVELPSAERKFSPLEYQVLTTANVVIYDRALASTVARFLPIGGYAEPAAPSNHASEITADLLRHLVQSPGVGLAGTVRACRDEDCDLLQHLGARAAQVRDAHTDRVGVAAAQPGQATRGIPHDQGQRPGKKPAQQQLVGAAQLGYALEQLVDSGGHECARLLGAPPFELVQPLHGFLVPRIGGETIDGVERKDHRLACADRSDRVARDAPVQRLPSTTRSRSFRSEVIVTFE